MKKNFLYYLLPSIIIGGASSLIMVPLTTYYLDPKDFGIAAIINAVTMPLGPLASTGVAWVLSAHYFVIDESQRKIMLFNLLVFDLISRFIWVALFWLLSPWLLPVIIKDFQPQYLFFFRLSLIALFLTTLWSSISALIVLQQRGFVHALFEVGQWLFGAIATVVCLVILRYRTLTLFLAPIASSAFSFFLGLLYVRKYITVKFVKKWLREMLKVGLPSMPTDFSEMARNISDRYFIQRWLNLSVLGLYSHSQSYRNMFIMGHRASMRTLSPIAIEIFSTGGSPQRLDLALKKWYGLLCAGGIFVTFFSREIVTILTHGKFTAAAPLVPIWYLMLFAFTYSYVYTNYLLVKKRNLFIMYMTIFVNICAIAFTGWAVFYFGIMGATVAIVLATLALQVAKKVYAAILGCPEVGDRYFYFGIALMLICYVAEKVVPLNIYEKILVVVVLCGFVSWRSRIVDDIITTLRTIGKRERNAS